jgi:hypothetical protein
LFPWAQAELFPWEQAELFPWVQAELFLWEQVAFLWEEDRFVLRGKLGEVLVLWSSFLRRKHWRIIRS